MPDQNRTLPDWIDAWMLLTENSEPPVLFRKWAGISTIASALQRKVRVELGISLKFYPNFYIVLVGPSATGKGTAMKYASDIISQVPQIRLAAQATSLQSLIRRMKETNLTDVNFETGDQQFHSSLTIFSNEFTVFLGYHNNEMIAALCDWFDCHERWTYDTIKRDKEEIVGVWVNILAGTTPESLQASLPMSSIGTGLTSRIIFVYEEKHSKLVILPSEDLKLQQCLVQDLEQVSMMSGVMSYTKDALEIYSDWCFDSLKNPPFYDKRFDGYCGRRRNHLWSLAMVCNASRGGDMIISSGDVQRSINLLNEVEVKMSLTFKGIGRSDIADLINDAIVFVENMEMPDVPMWQFARHFEGNMDRFTMERTLYTLEVSNYIKIIRKPGMDTIIHRLIDGKKN